MKGKNSIKETITVNFDGGSRGNPGPAGIGVVLWAEDGTPVVTLGKFIGNATNNTAEYMALILGMREAEKLGATKILLRGDSELVIKQMRGEYRVKNPGLKQLFDQAQNLANQFESVQFEHNLRHHNSLADRLVNLAMDRKGDVDDVDDVDDLGDVDESPARPTAQPASRFLCDACGCEIEVTKHPKNGMPGGNFICRCGTKMH
jgi:ribonuclease HI